MKIILLKDVQKIGRKNDIKDVSEGYAVNFLFPKKLALIANPANIEKVNKMKNQAESEKKVLEDLLIKNIDSVTEKTITIRAKANEKGHLFAGISKEDLVKEIEKETRIKIEPDRILLDKPIREVGNHIVDVKFGSKSGKIKVEVMAE
jgi:large subunit ribosomal protein L9